MKGPTLRVAFILLLALAATVGCKADLTPNRLTFAISSELEGTDIQQAYTSSIIHSLVSPAMVALDLENKHVVPQVATSVKLEGNTIEMVFPDNLTFTNGKPCTGAAIKASIERYIKISPYSADWAELDRIDVDGQKVSCVFQSPPVYFLAVLTSDYSGIIDVATAEAVGDGAFNRHVVGVGPYQLDEWVQGSHVTFRRYDQYQDFKPFVTNQGPWSFEKVVVRVIPDPLTRISELEAGNVDVAEIPAEFVDRVAGNHQLTLLKTPLAGQSCLRFNLDKAPFSHYTFRQAVNYAIDKEEIKAALKGTVEPIYGLLSPAQRCFSPETEAALKEKLAYDPQRAKALLAALGYADTNGDGYVEKGGQELKFTLLVTDDVASHALAAPVLQQQLKKVGIRVELQKQGRSYIRELENSGHFEISLAGWGWPDPDVWYYAFHKTTIGTASPPIWTNDTVSKLLDEGRIIPDVAERTAKYAELSQAIADELCIVSLFYDYSFTAHVRTLDGLHHSLHGDTYWNDAFRK